MARTGKIIIQSLTSLSFPKLWKLLTIVAPHPLFAIMSFHATVKSFALAKKHFPKTQGGNGKGNAFRHALWCCLILTYCCKISSPEKAKDWTKKITDMHEELFPNQPLETKMDLHNNQVGIDLFMKMLEGIHRQFFEPNFFVVELKELLKTAKVLKNMEDSFPNELVYLEE